MKKMKSSFFILTIILAMVSHLGAQLPPDKIEVSTNTFPFRILVPKIVIHNDFTLAFLTYQNNLTYSFVLIPETSTDGIKVHRYKSDDMANPMVVYSHPNLFFTGQTLIKVT